jgi:hypothetical protein
MHHSLASVKAVLENADILKTIFQYLDFPEDVCRLALVSKTWRDTAAAPEFWRVIDIQHLNVQPHVLCAILRRQHKVRSLNARGVELTTDHLAELLPLLTNLEHLELDKTGYCEQEITLLSRNLPRLRHLLLDGGIWVEHQPTQGGPGAIPLPIRPHHQDGEDDGPLALPQGMLHRGGLIAAHLQAMRRNPRLFPGLTHPTLQTLVLQNCASTNLPISCPNLTKLQLHHCSDVQLCVRGCPALRELELSGGLRSAEGFVRCLLGIAGDIDRWINNYITAMNADYGIPLQQLRALVLESNQCITDSVLEVCGRRFSNLTRLELRGCASVIGGGLGDGGDRPAVAAATNKWESLEELHVVNCDSLTGTLLSIAVDGMFALRSLHIEGCTSLASLDINSRSLRAIHLRTPEHLDNLGLRTLNLDTFNLYYNRSTGKPSALALRHLSIRSFNLRKLYLAGCPVLEDIQLGCTYLQELEVIECDALVSTGSHLPALQDSSALPELQKVGFHSCRMLSSINITADQVQEVKISDCKDLSDLRLKCDALSILDLVDCSYLAEIEVSSREMKSISLGCCHSLKQATLAPLPRLEELSLNGCNQLRTINLDCPVLRQVDASLCASFTDEAIAALARCPNLQQLKIGACSEVTASGITEIGVLKYLRALDISFMPLQDPRPLMRSIRGVVALTLSDNFAMEPEALCSMIHDVFNTSTVLRELNVSNCNIGPEAAAQLAVNCKLPLSLAVNVIRGTSAGNGSNQHQLWPALHLSNSTPDGCSTTFEGPISNVRALSMVKIVGIDAFYLGLVPKNLAEEHQFAGVPVYDEIWTCAETPFLHVETPLKNLKELNLGVGEFLKVAIALPYLSSLKLNLCGKMSEVTLHCPSLTRLSLAACRSMSAEAILTAIRGCPMLKYIDISLAGPGIKDIEALCGRIRQQQAGALEISISTPSRPTKPHIIEHVDDKND